MEKQKISPFCFEQSSIILLLLAVLLPEIECFNSDYYLSVNGSDSWDGTADINTPETSHGPWKSLPHAIKEIRKSRPNPPDSSTSVTLYILPGTYFLQETLELDQRDSYMNWYPSYPGANVVISGGIVLEPTKMRPSQGNIQSVVFEGNCGEAFLGNQRLIPARSPNGIWNKEESLYNIAVGPYNIIKELLVETETCKRNSTRNDACPDEDRDGFIFDNALYSSGWKDLDQTKVIVFHSWVAELAKVANITKSGNDWKVLFQEPLSHAPVGEYVGPSGWRFLFYNNKELLDEPGEYVCVERENMLSELSLIFPENVRNNKNFNNESPVIVSQLGVLVKFNKVNHFAIIGMKFRHSSSKYSDGWNWGKYSAIQIYSSSDITFEYSEISHVGMTGLYLKDSTTINIAKNNFHDIGYHALATMSSGDPGTSNVLVENNIFNGCGMNSYWSPSCLWITGSKNMNVRNNEVSIGPWSGIIIKKSKVNSNKPLKEENDYVFKVEYNDVHDYGLGILNDFGGIKVNPVGPCNTRNETEYAIYCFTYAHVYNNRIRKGRAFHSGANNIYSDAAGGKNTFENNLLYGEGQNALYHHCGIENLSQNNIIHRTSSNIQNKDTPDRYNNVWGGCEKPTVDKPQRYTNQRNIYLLDDIEDFTFGRPYDRFYDTSPEFHHNLYWSLAPGDAQSVKLFPGNLNWYEWQESGNDTFSKWQDPLFEDPLNHVYVLKSNSPAWDLGIKQIDLDNFGPQT